MNIIQNNFKYKKKMSNRVSTKYIVLHHRGGYGNVESIHNQHLNLDCEALATIYTLEKTV